MINFSTEIGITVQSAFRNKLESMNSETSVSLANCLFENRHTALTAEQLSESTGLEASRMSVYIKRLRALGFDIKNHSRNLANAKWQMVGIKTTDKRKTKQKLKVSNINATLNSVFN